MRKLNDFARLRRPETVVDRLLKLVAVRVELPPSYHALACERKAALESHIERAGSILEHLVVLFYVQGSMAIGATIRARHREDGYDIDIVVELRLPHSTPPNVVLDMLLQVVKGEPGSRYYDCTVRRTRCVTVEYADGMHVDLTPSILVEPASPRRSVIPHAKPEEPRHRDRMVQMNAFGFAEEFNERNPPDWVFAEDYAKVRKRMDSGSITIAAAESEPVPAHSSEVGGKSTTVVALQLIKRNRLLCYRPRDGVRMPPSVMISSIVLEAARPGRTLTEALTESVDHLRRRLQAAQDAGVLIDVRNPRDPQDRFTDRWPATLQDQRLYIRDLERLGRRLDDLQGAQSMKERSDILVELFGEAPARDAVAEIVREVAPHEPSTTQPASPAPAALAAPVLLAPRIAPAQPVRAPRNTNFGGTWTWPED